ncbi:MAG: DUF4105 domain-containing protein [Gammaproteobacteria bacterium]|nr:DUF4105 domain-containing protein [Gammaproteobacteria bacterium]
MRIRFILKLVLILFSIAPNIVQANVHRSNVDELVRRATEINLSQHPVWLKLLHYEKKFSNSSKVVSAIHDETFFNDVNGAVDPEAELEATLRAFLLPPPKSDIDAHAQCHFPARFIWLKASLGVEGSLLPTVNCPKFYAWTLNNTIQSVSLVYASGFLDNPASYYGHILLKFNSSKSKGDAQLFDPSVNYGAIVPDGEDPISYIVKGILGGYDGGFSQTDYYFHNHNYGELELRNIWEYEINFSQSEVDLIVAHAWELLAKPYTYYFFKQNCAYRLAEILEVVEGVQIIPSNPFFTLPRALLQNMANSEINNKPLIKTFEYRPSRQSRFYTKFNALNSSERSEVRNISKRVNEIGSTRYDALPVESKVRVVDALIDYYEFSEAVQFLSTEDFELYQREAIIERFKLPSNMSVKDSSSGEPPHTGRQSSYVRLGLTYNDVLGDGVTILLRPAYYDVLDASSGQVKSSALTMGELKVFVQSNRVRISEFNLLKIESINRFYTKLPGDNGQAWNIKLSLQQQSLACIDCLLPRIEGDYGFTMNLNPSVVMGVYAGGGIQGNRQDSGSAFIRTSVFSQIQFNETFNMRLNVELPKQIDGSGGQSERYTLEARQRLGVNADLRFMYEENDAKQLSVNFGYYF